MFFASTIALEQKKKMHFVKQISRIFSIIAFLASIILKLRHSEVTGSLGNVLNFRKETTV